MIKLSVLDQSPIPEGGTAAGALGATVELARAADRLGYHRYWVAEHHNTKAFAGSAPEIMIARLLEATRTIRVGSGGVMLPHYSPLKVAEQFRVLESLYPGRVDLGLGRAPGSDPKTSRALQPGPQAYDVSVFPQQVELLIQFLEDAAGLEGDDGGFPDGHPYRGIHASPLGPGMPELWMLGSGGDGAIHAGQFGMPYAHAHFINPDSAAQSLAAYRKYFRPSRLSREPRAALALSALVADTEEDARRIAMSRNLWVLHLLQNRAGRFPSVEEALAYPYTEEERATLAGIEQRSITGAPEQVRKRLLELSHAHDVEEIVVVTITHGQKDRLASYEMLAEAFALKEAA